MPDEVFGRNRRQQAHRITFPAKASSLQVFPIFVRQLKKCQTLRQTVPFDVRLAGVFSCDLFHGALRWQYLAFVIKDLVNPARPVQLLADPQ